MTVARADAKPGRRRAVPQGRSRRKRVPRPQAADSGAPLGPATGHDLETPEPIPPPKPARVRRWPGLLFRTLWTVLVLAGLIAVAPAWTPYDAPAWVTNAGAVTLTTTSAFALAVRTGGRPLLTGGLTLVLACAAVLTQQPMLLAAAAISTATIGTVLGVMVTIPAARVPAVARECLVAVVVAATAAFAADAYDPRVSLERAGYLVLGLSLLGALALAYRLAAGLHGLGRRGAVMLVSGLGLLAVSLAYTEALGRWGSQELVDSFERSTRDLAHLVGAIPRPTEFLLGIPALAWGVSTRARRRQGWWGTGFGAAGLAVVATSLLDPEVVLVEVGLATAYSLVVGLVLGYLVIRADSFLSGARGRRARRIEEASAHRPEPGRTHPLL
ncbi:MAG: hypothetical protein ABIQ59_14900 [Nocardioidaceae bacterium]